MTDINTRFGFSSRSNQRGKLSDYVFGLGLDAKLGHGKDALDWWNLIMSGDETAREKLLTYNQQDAKLTAEVLRRWLKPFSPHDVGTTPALEPVPIPF